MLSYRNRRIVLQILPFGVIPAIYTVVHALLEKGVLGDHPIYPSTGNPYEFRLVVPVITSFVTGCLIGVFEVFYVNSWFQGRSFSEKLIFKSSVYLCSIVVATAIIVVTGHSITLDLSPFDERVWRYTGAFFSSFAFWSIMCFFFLAIVSALFYFEVSNNMGHSVLMNFFTGKYHHPAVEERVFMFLDMKSSTTFAEQLGHIRYFEMLKEYYADLSEPIVLSGGEIYQYVGDEVVVTWKLKDGSAANCLNCFFSMKKVLSRNAYKYSSTYGVVPSFKAGIHCGKVTTGEIGVIKKDIAFSGDVLNTTARIQSLCNRYEVDLLVSDEFITALESNGQYNMVALGEVELRGKNEKINLFTIEGSGFVKIADHQGA